MRFTSTGVSVWNDPKFLALGHDEMLIMSYLRQAPEMTALGCFVLWQSVVAEKLRYPQRTVTMALKRLEQEGFISYDAVSRLVYIRDHFTCNPIRSADAVKGAMKILQEFPASDVLLTVAADLQQRRMPKFQEELDELIRALQCRAGKSLAVPITGGLFDRLTEGQTGGLTGGLTGGQTGVSNQGYPPSTVPVPEPENPSPKPPATAATRGGEGGGFRPRVGSGEGRLLSELTRAELDWYATQCRLPDHKAAATRYLRQLDERSKAPPETRPPEERYREVIEAQEELPQPGTPEYAEHIRRIKRSMMAAPAAISGVLAQVMAGGGDDEEP